jgi:hypothetical protein
MADSDDEMPPGNSVAEGRSATVCAGRVKVTYDNWRRKHPVQGFRLMHA